MKTSESTKELTTALITFHEEVNNIPKTASNPFFKSKYVPLEKILTAIREPLKTANLSFVQFPEDEGGLTTRLMHTSGEWIEATYYMKPTKPDPQGYGSVITYQRRYALSAILGLNTDEDDDGNKASEKPELLSDVQYKRLEFLISNSTYSDDEKERLYSRLDLMTTDKFADSEAKLLLSQRAANENENMSQKHINQELDRKLKNEKA